MLTLTWFKSSRVIGKLSFLLAARQHVLTRDTRNERIYPSQGYLVQLSQELAGDKLGGDVSFLKAEAELQLNKKLLKDCVSLVCQQSSGCESEDSLNEKGQSATFLLRSIRSFHWASTERTCTQVLRLEGFHGEKT